MRQASKKCCVIPRCSPGSIKLPRRFQRRMHCCLPGCGCLERARDHYDTTGRSGLGLEAQKEALERFVTSKGFIARAGSVQGWRDWGPKAPIDKSASPSAVLIVRFVKALQVIQRPKICARTGSAVRLNAGMAGASLSSFARAARTAARARALTANVVIELMLKVPKT
jgi:hypothetical protein